MRVTVIAFAVVFIVATVVSAVPTNLEPVETLDDSNVTIDSQSSDDQALLRPKRFILAKLALAKIGLLGLG